MKKCIYFLLVCCWMVQSAAAQQKCAAFDELMRRGQAHHEAKPARHQDAINAYMEAMLDCPERAKQAQAKISAIFQEINKLREDAEYAKQIANNSKMRVKAEASKNNIYVESIYFYKDRFGVAEQKGPDGKSVYGFIDKRGETRIAFDYTFAKPFDMWTGLAIVKKKVNKKDELFLLDTAGNEYRMAYEPSTDTTVVALDLQSTDMETLPDDIWQMRQLQILLLGRNKIKSLPKNIAALSNLKILYAFNNQIDSLPAEIGSLKNLTRLNLVANQLTSLPAEIGGLKNLTTLYLTNNQLTSLPSEIGSLTNLMEFSLHGNQLTSLPAEIGGLKNLKGLSIGNNLFTSLPAEIGDLVNLTGLDLSGIPFTILPAEIGGLRKLTELNWVQSRFVPPLAYGWCKDRRLWMKIFHRLARQVALRKNSFSTFSLYQKVLAFLNLRLMILRMPDSIIPLPQAWLFSLK